MVDLSELKVGDIVVLRNGKRKETLLVERYSKEGKDEYGICIKDYDYIIFQKDGHCYDDKTESKYDIVEIIKQKKRKKGKKDMVDLSDLKAGDKVKLRDGQVLEVVEITKVDNKTRYDYLLSGLNYRSFYTKDGHNYADGEIDDKDIVEIIPKSKEESDKPKVDLHNIAEGDVVYCDDGSEHVVDNVTFDQNYAVITLYDFGTFEFNYDGTKFQEDAEIGDIVNVLHGNSDPDKEPSKPAADAVNHPSHYKIGGVECIQAIKASMTEEAYKGFLKGNIIKYIWRYEIKGKPIEDLKKARVYLNWLIKEIEE